MRVAALAAVLPTVALAAPATASTAAEPAALPGMGAALFQGAVGLAIVLALVWGLAWLARRGLPATAGDASPIRIVATRSLGVREKIVLVEVGENWLVLGVAPGRVNALHTLPKGVVPEAAAQANPFATLLDRAKGKR